MPDTTIHIGFSLKTGVWILFFMLTVCLLFQKNALGAETAEPVIRDIIFNMDGRPDTIARLKNISEKLITLKKGERFSVEALKESIHLLKRSRIFSAINVPDPDFTEPEITLTFHLTPYTHIKDIRITGGFPLLEKKILNALTLYTGDVFDPDKLEQQESRIELLFLEAGYIIPDVSVTSEEDPLDGNHVINIAIDKGDYYRIRKVEIFGNESFFEGRLKLRTDAWKSKLLWSDAKRYVRKKLDDDIKNLIQFYRSKGFYDVDITQVVENSKGSRSIYIKIIIDEGPCYSIRFKGNSHFWDYTLKKDLLLESRGNLNDIALKRSIRNIKQRYEKSGFSEAIITIKEETGEEDVKHRNICLVIEEGVRSVIKSLKITGNDSLSSRQIKKQILTDTSGLFSGGGFHKQTLEEDIAAIRTLYSTSGFPDCTVDDTIQWNINNKKQIRYGDLTLNVTEGTPAVTGDITFRNLQSIPESTVLEKLSLKPGSPFSEKALSNDETLITSMVSEAGYPHVNVTGSYAKTNDSSVPVTFEIEEGPKAVMGEVFCTGNFKTRESIINNEVSLEEGQPFSLATMLESQRNIRDINALQSANFKLPGLNEKSETVHLFVEAEEKKPYYFQLGLGYDTKRKSYANTRMGDQNLLGLNKNAWVSGEVSEIGYRGETGITEPRFLGTRISSTVNMYTEEIEEFNKDFGTQNYGGGIVFQRRFLKKFTSALSCRYEFKRQYQIDAELIAPSAEDQYERRNVVILTPSIIYNTTDSYVNPRSGVYAAFSIDVSEGVNNTFDDFFKHRLELRYFYSPLDRLTFAVRGRYGYIEPGDKNTSISEDNLFFLGGTSDVRGYDENMLRYNLSGDPVGGRSEVLGSLEARFNVWNNLEVTSFFDIGSIRYTYEDDDHNGFRSSAGTGLRYITPIGPIGFLFGWKINPRKEESSGKLHFTIGHTF